jgi:hypothetical protein
LLGGPKKWPITLRRWRVVGQHQVRELQRMPGEKWPENEILRDALI